MKNRRKLIKNWSEIDAKMMLGFKIAFWTYLVRLGSHLGTNKFGKRRTVRFEGRTAHRDRAAGSLPLTCGVDPCQSPLGSVATNVED